MRVRNLATGVVKSQLNCLIKLGWQIQMEEAPKHTKWSVFNQQF